jgi:hypothetical protein
VRVSRLATGPRAGDAERADAGADAGQQFPSCEFH